MSNLFPPTANLSALEQAYLQEQMYRQQQNALAYSDFFDSQEKNTPPAHNNDSNLLLLLED